jgi:hypothetical protein
VSAAADPSRALNVLASTLAALDEAEATRKVEAEWAAAAAVAAQKLKNEEEEEEQKKAAEDKQAEEEDGDGEE